MDESAARGYPASDPPPHLFTAKAVQVLTCDWVPAELPQVREHGDNGPCWHWYVSQAARAGHGVTTGSQPPGHNWGGT